MLRFDRTVGPAGAFVIVSAAADDGAAPSPHAAASCSSASSLQSEHTLRFDPTVGTAGGFVVVRGSHAAGELLAAAAEAEEEEEAEMEAAAAAAAVPPLSPGRTASVTFAAAKPRCVLTRTRCVLTRARCVLTRTMCVLTRTRAKKEAPTGEAALKAAAKAAVRAAMTATKKGNRTVCSALQSPSELSPILYHHPQGGTSGAPTPIERGANMRLARVFASFCGLCAAGWWLPELCTETALSCAALLHMQMAPQQPSGQLVFVSAEEMRRSTEAAAARGASSPVTAMAVARQLAQHNALTATRRHGPPAVPVPHDHLSGIMEEFTRALSDRSNGSELSFAGQWTPQQQRGGGRNGGGRSSTQSSLDCSGWEEKPKPTSRWQPRARQCLDRRWEGDLTRLSSPTSSRGSKRLTAGCVLVGPMAY
jgi:hypothetical protein